MHPLLRRQLRRLGLDEGAPPTAEQWCALLERLGRTYAEADQDRYTLERSLMISSREMQALYDDLRSSAAAQLSAKHGELQKSLALADAIREAVIDGILVVDEGMSVIAINRRFVEMWDLPEALAATGDGWAMLRHVVGRMADPDGYLAKVQHNVANPREISHLEVRLRDGRIYDRYSAPVDAGGKLFGRVICFRDVTERRRLEEERLVVSERMASLGSLVASVAHEINNPLTYVLANLNFAAEELRAAPIDAEVNAALRDATDGVERIRRIVADLRLIARPQRERVLRVDVHEVLDAAAQMSAHAVRHHARLVRRYGPPAFVEADPIRLGQVFLNLLVNAAQALEAGRARDHAITLGTRRGADGRVLVEVTDTGPGIRPEHLDRIFDPFFTTKAAGAGSGLGLSICRGIVESYGGAIRAENAQGGGARFVVDLPAAADAPFAAAVATPAGVPAARGRVLVVDDEPDIRATIRRVLGGDHEVVVCESARAALALLEGDARFDVVLCDLMMPDLTGMDLHDHLVAHRPALAPALVFVTGGVFTPGAEAFLARSTCPVLQKPFTADELRRAVAGVLAARLAA